MWQGLPISIKVSVELADKLRRLSLMVQDHVNLAGRKSTAGFSGDILQPPATKNGFLAQILYDAGAGK
jgi:hypothetical protein